MKIEVLEIRLLNDGRPLRGFCDVQINDWIIRDFRIIKESGKRVFVSPPQVSWRDPQTGQIKYRGILTIPPEQKQRIDTQILHAYLEEMEKTNGESKE